MDCYYDNLAKNINELGKLHSFLLKKDLHNIRIIPLHDKVILKFTALGVLSRARKIAKRYYPDWTDKLTQVWGAYDNIVMTSWECREHRNLHLWLQSTVEDYPESLKRPSCRFEKTTTHIFDLICDI